MPLMFKVYFFYFLLKFVDELHTFGKNSYFNDNSSFLQPGFYLVGWAYTEITSLWLDHQTGWKQLIQIIQSALFGGRTECDHLWFR